LIMVMIIPIQAPILARDYLSGVYNIPTYYISVLTFFTLDILVCALINTAIMFWMIFGGTAIDENYVFPRFLGVMLLTSLVSAAMGMLFSCLAHSFEQATSFVTLSVLFLLFGGFLIPQNEIWPLLKVFLYLSPWFYSQELSMEFVYKNMSALCDFKGPNETKMPLLEEEMLKPEVDSVKVQDILADMCVHRCEHGDDKCCDNFLDGQGHLDRFSLSENTTRDLLVLVAFMFGCHLVAIIVLSAKMYFKKK